MVVKITELTTVQAARFGEWTKQWIEIGLSTEPADFDKTTTAALRGYELANLKKPMVVLRMASPYGATLGGALAWAMLREIGGGAAGQRPVAARSRRGSALSGHGKIAVGRSAVVADRNRRALRVAARHGSGLRQQERAHCHTSFETCEPSQATSPT